MRKRLPERRRSWTQKVRIENQPLYVTFGEYEDGRLGELFIDASKQGTMFRGVLDALARCISLALQCGATAEEVVHTLRGMNFPPNGPILGSQVAVEASSLADWLAQEIQGYYIPIKSS